MANVMFAAGHQVLCELKLASVCLCMSKKEKRQLDVCRGLCNSRMWQRYMVSLNCVRQHIVFLGVYVYVCTELV